MNSILDYRAVEDCRLVELHLGGDGRAFRQIVERHQAMVCALGLSRCGDIGHSEELAQEVFVAAWKQLPELREPRKLRAWLAGIARNVSNNSLRRQQRTPTARTEELSDELPADAANPRERAIRADQAALMWSALESIPENYREPMVLFYREHRSVPAVAAALEISEDTVRQRLVRGRAMLSERMAALVEETLERSAPTPAFAGAVLLALPAGAGTLAGEAALGTGGAAAKAAAVAGGVAAAGAKGGLAMKALAVAGILPAVFSGLMDFLKFRSHYEASDSVAHRRRIAIAHLAPNLMGAVLMLTVLTMIVLTSTQILKDHLSPTVWAGCIVAVLIAALVAGARVKRWATRREEEDMQAGDVAAFSAPVSVKQSFEFRSRRSWLGWPLLHVRVGDGTEGGRRTARGWIAVSDGVALGGFIACGARLAVAPLSFGFCAIGLLSLGVVGAAAGMIGALALGGWSYGGVIALGWIAAHGHTYAAAGEFAQGFNASAAHANDAAAAAFFEHSVFFRAAGAIWDMAMASLWFLWVPSLLLIGWHLWRARQK